MPTPIRTARELRQQMTDEEKSLWNYLRNRNFQQLKFRRQHPVVYEVRGFRKYFYVADFYCAERKFIIELDGKHHEFGDQKEYDNARDFILNKLGYKILRIPNDEIRKNLLGTLKLIEEEIKK